MCGVVNSVQVSKTVPGRNGKRRIFSINMKAALVDLHIYLFCTFLPICMCVKYDIFIFPAIFADPYTSVLSPQHEPFPCTFLDKWLWLLLFLSICYLCTMQYRGTVTLLQKEVHDPSCIGMTSTAYILEIVCLLLFAFIPR